VDLLVLTDTPEVTLDDAGKPRTSAVQIAKTGVFVDPRYGKFSITQRDFSKWTQNFNALAKDGDRIGLPLDVDHSSEKEGKTEAAGWITGISTKGTELWAEVEWNSLGVDLVSDRRYAYISPSYQHNFKDEKGTAHGTALVGAALTNRPFLNMATVSLSKDFTVAQLTDEDPEAVALSTSDSPGEMPDFQNIAKSLSLAADADEAAILAKVEELKTPKAPESNNVDLAAVAKEQGMIVLSSDDFSTLAAGAASGKAAQEELHNAKFLNAFNAGIEAGTHVPAQQDSLRDLYDISPEKTLAAMTAAPKILSTELVGSSGGSGLAGGPTASQEYGGNVDEDRLALDARAQVLAAERKIDYADAVLLAVDEMGV